MLNNEKLQEKKIILAKRAKLNQTQIAKILGISQPTFNLMKPRIQNCLLIEFLLKEQERMALIGSDFIDHCEKLLEDYH